MSRGDDRPRLRSTRVGEDDLAWWERGRHLAGRKPALVFAHATGFHGRVFDAIVEHFPDRHVIQLDMRGHGRSGGGPVADWKVLAADIAAVLDDADISAADGIGHSMGGHALLQCAADRPDLFEKLALFDPVILEPDYYRDRSPIEEHPTARRKSHFASPDEMIARFAERDPYVIFDRRVFEDYCRFGLLPAESGDGMELACAPQTEASVYMSSRSNAGILDAAKSVAIPVLVVRARKLDLMDFKSSPTWPELAGSMPNGRDLHRPDMTHFHPFQDPADAAAIIAGWLSPD